MSGLITVSPVELLLRVSAASVGAGEQPPNTNRGPFVKRVLARTKLGEGYPWCAAVVADWGAIALGSAWPVPLTASVPQLAEWARRENCRYIPSGVGNGVPQVGDLYVKWYANKNRFAHVGLIVQIDGLRVYTRDGNTSDPKDTDPERQREGWGVFEKWRTLTERDRLIRWTQVLR